MYYEKLPTDNLYKFLAITGLVGLLASVWLNEQDRQHTLSEYDKLINRTSVLTADFHDFLQFGEHIGETDEVHEELPDFITYDEKERDRWLKHFDMHHRIIKTLSSIPAVSDDDVKRQWMGYLNLTGDEYDAMLRDPKFTRILETNRMLVVLRYRKMSWILRCSCYGRYLTIGFYTGSSLMYRLDCQVQ